MQISIGVARLFLVVIGVVGLGLAASASPIVDGGLTASIACPDGANPCSTSANFSLDPPTPAKLTTGSITFTPTTATISFLVPSYSMTGSSGSVTDIDFTNVSYSATVGISVIDFGGGMIQVNQDLGFATGSVSGTYDQIGGPGSGPFSDLSVSFANLSCFLIDGVGTCGVDVGSFAQNADFSLDVDGVDHDVVQSFNVVVPEPSTLALLGLGMLALAGRRR